jgi:hypothetical protein
VAAADAAGGAFREGRELGDELLCLLGVAVGAYSVFGFGSHGLQEHEILVAGFTTIFIKRHEQFLQIKKQLAITAFARTESVKYNTQGAKTCQGKNGQHGAHETREQEPVGMDKEPEQGAAEDEDPREESDQPFKIPRFCAGYVHLFPPCIDYGLVESQIPIVCHAELVSASRLIIRSETLKRVQGDGLDVLGDHHRCR